MHRSLIVARMKPDAASRVAETFAESDRGELPGLIGVTGRSLFQFGEDLYLHLIEAERPPGPAVAEHTGNEEFRRISAALAPYISAYDPVRWRGPQDAMAREFYRWEKDA